MMPIKITPRRLLAAALAGAAMLLSNPPCLATGARQTSFAAADDASDPVDADISDRLPELVEALFGADEAAAAQARFALLQADLDHEALVAIAAAAQSPLQLAVAEGIARHQVLTRLRRDELADLEDDAVIVGFQFQVAATAGQVGPDTSELVARFPIGAQVSTTTAGFPGYAYLRPNDMIVQIDGESLPEDRAAAQQYVINRVQAHALDEPLALTLIRDGQRVELSVPLARAAALPRMYNPRTLTRDLIDPFLFLWEEAWSTIKLDAGYEEDEG